jgi:aspartyl-tRNA(Asn)/glutamyl-tRNA(Gln) amidotransferase subunit C
VTISIEEARKVARLARLDLSDDELARYAGQLDAILEHVAQLDELDTDGVEATTHVVPDLSCPWREDQPLPSTEREVIVGRAPRHEEGFFQVPKIINSKHSAND